MATPVEIAFNNTAFLGPDGPWQMLTLPVGSPIQYVDFYPIRDSSIPSLFISSESCQASSQCPTPQPLYYNATQFNNSDNSLEIADTSNQDVSNWDSSIAQLMSLTGLAKIWEESFTITQSGSSTSFHADDIDILVSTSVYTNYPNGVAYAPPSFLSLSAQTLPLPLATNENNQAQSLLSDYTAAGKIESASWGMHIGSAAQGINGSLYLGGYDQNRVIEPPISQPLDKLFDLTSITLGTAAGVSPFSVDANNGENLLQVNGSTTAISTGIEPGVPYMYLPKSTCDAMASFLPITYNPDFNLYTWNTESPQYVEIVQSLSYLNFTFNGAGSSQPATSIRVPFSVLNLTMEAPFYDVPTSYFPCYPIEFNFHLGRAFLQAAFLAINYNSSTIYLGQAPGPSLPNSHPIIQSMAATDSTIQPLVQAPSWEATWTPVLKALASVSSGPPDFDTNDPTDDGDINDLSFADKAGITAAVNVVILAIGVYLGIFFWRRRERKARARWLATNTANDVPPLPPPKHAQELVGDHSLERDPMELYDKEHGKKYAWEAPAQPARESARSKLEREKETQRQKQQEKEGSAELPGRNGSVDSGTTGSISIGIGGSISAAIAKRMSPEVPPKSPRWLRQPRMPHTPRTPRTPREMEADSRFMRAGTSLDRDSRL